MPDSDTVHIPHGPIPHGPIPHDPIPHDPGPPRGAELFEQAFTRVSGAPAVGGNAVRLLRDAGENYPAWLEAIATARRFVHFENYIVADDRIGRAFAEALAERARAGVAVRVLYDWWGCLGEAGTEFWEGLRRAGAEVRVFNRPRLRAPFGWISRDHRKLLTVDGAVGFVSGLCVAEDWAGRPPEGPAGEGQPAWRDTGVELRGPAVADLDRAFAGTWWVAGGTLPPLEAGAGAAAGAGPAAVRVVRGRPGQLSAYRLDQLVAAGARKTLWLTDAYFVATTGYVRALTEADRDGVDVRILLPGASDVPLAQALSRTGYRPLLETGIRIYEWNGPMLHAKTAVCDGRWARVGSTNLNPTSWLTNWELDVTVDDPGFAAEMESMFLADLAQATEVVPETRRRRHFLGHGHRHHPPGHPRRGSGGRLAAGAISLGSAAGAAITGSRPLAAAEGGAVLGLGLGLLGFAGLALLFPLLVAVPAALASAWAGLVMLSRSRLLRRGTPPPDALPETVPPDAPADAPPPATLSPDAPPARPPGT